MTKCQHGDRINTFCLYLNCTEKQISGCCKCMQQHHNHGANTDIMGEDDIMRNLQKLVFDKHVKPFSQSLIHKIYTLLTSYKVCISHAIDSLSTNTVNKLGHAFMFGKPQFQTYNKLRKKQYRKVNQQELKSFLNFTKTLNPQWIEQIQQTRYQEFSEEVIKTIEQLNRSFYTLKDILPFERFRISDYEKNYQELKLINNEKKQFMQEKTKSINPVKKLNLERGQRIHKPPQLNKFTPQNLNLDLPMRRFSDRPRVLDPSIDRKISMRMQKSNSVVHNDLKDNDAKINNFNETADSFDFKNNLRHLVRQNNNYLRPQNYNMRFSQPLEVKEEILNKKISYQMPKDVNNEEAKEMQQSQPKHRKRSRYWKLSEEIDKQAFPIDLIVGNIIRHTILPDPVDNSTPYENAQSVQNKTITVPIGINQQQVQEVSSPIFKKFKDRKKKGGLFVINKILQHQQNKAIEDADDHQFTENQTLSLGILLKALPEASTSQAIKMLQEAYKLAPNNISAAQYLSYLYIMQNRAQQCLNLCNTVLEKIANSPNFDENCNIRNNKAVALNLLGRFSEAIKLLQKCLSEKKKDILYKNAGDAYYGIGIYEKAIINYEQCLKLNNSNHEAHFNLAACFYIQGSYHSCKVHLDRALELSHGNQEYKQLKQQLAKIQ